jgi:hypothetical protein
LWWHFKREGLSDTEIDAELWAPKKFKLKEALFAVEVGFGVPLAMIAALGGGALLWYNFIAPANETPYRPQPAAAMRSLGPQPGRLAVTRAELLPPLLRDGKVLADARPRIVVDLESRLPVAAVLHSFSIALYTAAGSRLPLSQSSLAADLRMPPGQGYEIVAEFGGKPHVLQICAAIAEGAAPADREILLLVLSGTTFVQPAGNSEIRVAQNPACTN